MITTNQAAATTVYTAADSISAIAGQLSEYSDAVWDVDNVTIRKRPPAPAVRQCRKRLQKLDQILNELEIACG